MLKTIKNLFSRKRKEKLRDYTGFSDFFLRASVDEKKQVITEAAHKANEDQLKIFKEAQLKVKTN